jgi:predicted ATPase
MISSLRIKNFKGWQDTGEIRLAPLTVFFGANSSGKSSINQFLLLLKQTWQSPDRNRVLHFGDERTMIDLGSYTDAVYQHKIEKPISFEIEWKLNKLLEFKNQLNKKEIYKGDFIKFSSEISSFLGKDTPPIVERFVYNLISSKGQELAVGMKRSEAEKGKIEYSAESQTFHLVKKPGRAWPLPSPYKFYGFPDVFFSYHQNAEDVTDFVVEIETLFKNIYYLGPLREHPHRTYKWSDELPEHVGWRGEDTIPAILSAKANRRQIRLKGARAYNYFEELIAFWLKEMALIEDFKIEHIADSKQYRTSVKISPYSEYVSILDVGFGISQVLPVIVQCFYAAPYTTTILEEPEIHLHPSVQASLADLFIAATNAIENRNSKNIQLIVESHSEHLLRRLQRRIAEGKIGIKDIAVYFCENTNSGSIIRPIDVDLYGNITNWPDNFFGDEVEDITAQMEAEMNKRLKEAGAK